MASDQTLSPELPHMTPIACEKCGGVAKLVSATIDSVSRGVNETWTYVCASCGHQMTREIEH